MAWLRSIVQSACFVGCFLTGCLPTPPARAAGTGVPAAETTRPTVEASVRHLLDTRRLGPAATYQQLGLGAGPAVHSLYARRDYETYWVQEAGWNPQARQVLALLGRAAEVGLDQRRYGIPELGTLLDSVHLSDPDRLVYLAHCELRLTDAVLRYADHLRRGVCPPARNSAADSLNLQATTHLVQQALAASAPAEALLRLQPATRAYRQLQAVWARTLRGGSPTDSLRLMRDSLAGFRRVALNLERLRWEPLAPDSDYILVNIPAYRLQVVRSGQVVSTHRVVVGRPETPTPVLSSRLAVFVTAPEWRVPYSIAVREFLPELQRDPGYLSDHHYRLYDGRNRLVNPWRVNWQRITPATFAYSIRQRAGGFNALGRVVFYFPNQHTVFLHDTPARQAFTRPDRALSHGCVRVERPVQLAEYLLRRENRLAELPALHQSIRQTARQQFVLQQPLPVYFRYYTCEAENGRLRFLPDIYRNDEELAAILFIQ